MREDKKLQGNWFWFLFLTPRITLISCGSVSHRTPGRLSKSTALEASYCCAFKLALEWSLAGWSALWKNKLKKWSKWGTFSTWQKALKKQQRWVRKTYGNGGHILYVPKRLDLSQIHRLSSFLLSLMKNYCYNVIAPKTYFQMHWVHGIMEEPQG